MTLYESIPDKEYILESTELNEKIERRLEALGLIFGTRIQVLNKKKNGTMIFKARGTRLAIGKEIASGIFVKEAEK